MIRKTAAPGSSQPAAKVLGVAITHPDKALWPAEPAPITKLELARYYEAAAERLLAHIRGRPCSILRAPEGLAGASFLQRHPGRAASPCFTAVETAGGPYLQFDRPEALIAAAQIEAVEFHPWNCAPFTPETPGRLVFDLDPAPDVPFADVVGAAHEVRARLDDAGLAAFCKTTGGKGLHVVSPIAAEGLGWAAAKAFALALCRAMAADAPGRYLTGLGRSARSGRIFLDYLRNDRTATAVAPFSPRARAGAPISAPLDWSQVTAELDPAHFTVRTALALPDWEGWAEASRPLEPALARLETSETSS